jgi:hypothetical protein
LENLEQENAGQENIWHAEYAYAELKLPQLNIPHRMISAFFQDQMGARARWQNVLSQIHAVDLVPD